MTDRPTLSSFEARVAADLERYVAGANDPRPAGEIADAAMRPRGITARVTASRRSRRLPFLVLAAALLVPAAYLAASLIRLPESDFRAVVIREGAGSVPGVSIFAVRPDGAERLLREVPNSILPAGNSLADWGTASESGWIALAETGSPWRMVLVDLRDPASEPWIVPGTNVGVHGPAFGPTGLIAAPGGDGTGSTLVIVDLETRATPTVMDDHGLTGDGPIVWNGDLPDFGEGGPRLRVCSAGSGCLTGDDGHVELVPAFDPGTTIYEQKGSERVLAASFGADPDKYMILLDSDAGRHVVAMQLDRGTPTRLTTINRSSDWRYVSSPVLAPDGTIVTLSIDVGGKLAMVIAPVGGGTPTFHDGYIAGFVAAVIADSVAGDPYTNSGGEHIEPSVAYGMTPLDELIADELQLNPGEPVLASGSRDGVPGETAGATYQVTVREAGTGAAYIDCFGPASLTVSALGRSATSPCLRDGTRSLGLNNLEPGDVIWVETTGEVSWRIAVYGCENCEFP